MSRLLARLIVSLRYVIVLAWIGGAVAATLTLPSIEEADAGAIGALLPDDAPALRAEQASNDLFRFPVLSRVIVVQRDPEGLSAAAQLRALQRAARLSIGEERRDFPEVGAAITITNAIGSPPFARERDTTALTYLFVPPDVRERTQLEVGRRLVEKRIAPTDAPVGVTGTLPARATQTDLIIDRLPLVELLTILLVVSAVALHFRAVLSPLVNVVAVSIAFLIASRTVAAVGKELDFSVPSEVQPVIVVLLFGVVTDYSIFFLSRFRALLADGHAKREASVRTTTELLPILLAAGLTIVLASGSLIFAELDFLRAFGPGMAFAVLVGLLVAVTLIPATLAIFGSALFWPRRPARELPREAAAEEPRPSSPRHPLRRRRTRAVTLAVRHPLAVTLGCLVLLLAGASGVLSMNLGNPIVRGLPSDAEPAVAYRAAAQGFAPGVLAPTAVVVRGPGVVRQREELEALQAVLAAQPGVAQVVGPATLPVEGLSPMGAVLSRSGNAARYVLFYDSDPLGPDAVRRVRNLDDRLEGLLDLIGLPRAEALVAGDTALVAETIDATYDDVRRIAPMALVVVFLIMALLLRALIAPLYLVGASVLALLASLGVATYLFQEVLGQPGLEYFVPVATGVLLVALGSDYNVFLVGRVHQEARRRGPLREAIAEGASRAATPIAVAGLVLAGSFALLGLVPTRAFHQTAAVMALGLLIDAFVVRTLLVPAVMALVGRWSFWPGRPGTIGAEGVVPSEGPPALRRTQARAPMPPAKVRRGVRARLRRRPRP